MGSKTNKGRKQAITPILPAPNMDTNLIAAQLALHQKKAFETQQTNFLGYLLEDTSTPEAIRKLWFGFLDKETALTNLTESDISKMQMYFEDANLADAMTRPEYEHTFGQEFIISQVRARLFLKLKRSQGGFERKMVTTSTSQIIHQSDEQPKVGGLLGGLRQKMFGGR